MKGGAENDQDEVVRAINEANSVEELRSLSRDLVDLLEAQQKEVASATQELACAQDLVAQLVERVQEQEEEIRQLSHAGAGVHCPSWEASRGAHESTLDINGTSRSFAGVRTGHLELSRTGGAAAMTPTRGGTARGLANGLSPDPIAKSWEHW